MKGQDLKHDMVVRYRTGRDAGGDSIAPAWSEWKEGPLYLVRREVDLPKKYRKRCVFWMAGSILTLRVPDWPAEYGQGDYCGNGCFLVEDWYLEIEGLENDDYSNTAIPM